jgi:hypothetical protein
VDCKECKQWESIKGIPIEKIDFITKQKKKDLRSSKLPCSDCRNACPKKDFKSGWIADNELIFQLFQNRYLLGQTVDSDYENSAFVFQCFNQLANIKEKFDRYELAKIIFPSTMV